MADPQTIKEAFERNRKAIELRPSVGQSTALTKVRVRDGTTCEIESGSKTLVCDVGKIEGGNDAGPGPGIFERSALGSCLAIGYAQQAAVMEVPIDNIEVQVESEFDARGQFGLSDDPPGFKALRYRVMIESSAPEETVRELINKADARSPVLDDFRRPIPVERKVEITSTRVKTS
ncbi:OsmC family protein [Fodinibius salsisoli]|uniref:OsmC family protein n=1 Tax=Fodinibius salsisoli TaxID=2820877 RepID=A0ABT3PJM3_9BACT|nr:OsmC family protein [Fodinibius salsisoli]MCW9706127.1 OsmC family protein [Fodinibius salsisoli]